MNIMPRITATEALEREKQYWDNVGKEHEASLKKFYESMMKEIMEKVGVLVTGSK